MATGRAGQLKWVGFGFWDDSDMTPTERWLQLEALLHTLWRDTLKFPWRNTAMTLRERFREDRLGVTASSLTFTTTISLVPLVTVALAIFSAFPKFAVLQIRLQSWLVQSLVPNNIAQQVLSYLNQFAAKAGQMGWAGALALLITALALILTIDRKLNDIWRVRESRPLTQRVLVYWAVLTLGPLFLAGSLAVTSYAVSASKGLVASMPDTLKLLLDTLQFALLTAGVAALYRYVPNTRVRWSHALMGGLFVAAGLELAKKLLALYLSIVPTYSMVYGTFASLPILLIWIYLVWVIVLLGAVVAAYLPSLLSGIARRGDTPGWNYQLALELVNQLVQARNTEAHTTKVQGRDAASRGVSLEHLARALRVDGLQLEEPLRVLRQLDWAGCLDEEGARWVLLIEPSLTPLAPLANSLLLRRTLHTEAMWEASGWNRLTLEQALVNSLGSETAASPPAPAALEVGYVSP
jgi:membrane protein